VTAPQPVRPLHEYPFTHPAIARFADVDSLGHLNNVAIATYYEDARVEFLRRVAGRAGLAGLGLAQGGAEFSVVLAEITVRYLAETHYPASLVVAMGVSHVGSSSMTNDCGLFLDGVCVGTARSTLVHVADHRPAPIPADVRTAMEQLRFAPTG
jgi:acyl-CoA thioester hydrolase